MQKSTYEAMKLFSMANAVSATLMAVYFAMSGDWKMAGPFIFAGIAAAHAVRMCANAIDNQA